MSSILISYPTGAGGEHLWNIIIAAGNFIKDPVGIQTVLAQYSPDHFHLVDNGITSLRSAGLANIKKIEHLEDQPDKNSVFHGRFGDMMSAQKAICALPEKKFIVITPNDITDPDYYQVEQRFLYQPIIYSSLFRAKPTHILSIPAADWCCVNINRPLLQISQLLNTSFDLDLANRMHSLWVKNNNMRD